MTPRARWLLAACVMAAVGFAFVWALAGLERRWDEQGVQRVPVRRVHPRR